MLVSVYRFPTVYMASAAATFGFVVNPSESWLLRESTNVRRRIMIQKALSQYEVEGFMVANTAALA